MNISAEQHYDDELSLSDLLGFLAKNWISILSGGAAGVALALGYLMTATPVYESKLQIEMARTNGQNGDVRGVPIEEPALLVERLRLPSTYTTAVAKTCVPNDVAKPFDQLVQRVIAQPVKNVNGVVQVTVLHGSPERTKACGEAVFEMVRAQQNQLLAPLLQEARREIETMQARLGANQKFLASMENTNMQSAVYLAKRDESLWLMDQVSMLERSLRHTTETRLVSPVYVADETISPRRGLALIGGLFGGLLMGVLWALIRAQLPKRTKEA